MSSTKQETPWLGRFLTRRLAPWIALVPILVAIFAIGAFGDGERTEMASDTLPAGTQSAQSIALIDQLPETDDAAIVVFEATSGTFDAGTLRQIDDVARALGATPGETGPLTVADDDSAALAAVPLDASTEKERTEAVKNLRAALAESTPDGVNALVTGPDAVTADLDAVFDGANVTLLGATVAVVALLLIITYRSPVLFLIPLLVVGVADRLASVVATHVMVGLDVAFGPATTSILSILVFGAGTDYALLLISRYRSELANHESRFDAMTVALRRTAEAVLTSAVTVILGVLTLVLSLTPATRALGVASAIGIAVASAFVLVVLPALLVCFGRWVFWPRIPHLASTSATTADALVERSLWFRVGTVVARRPRAIIVGSLVVVAVASTGLFGISLGLDAAESFTDKPEAIAGAERLAESFPAGASDPVQIVTRTDGATILRVVEEHRGVESAAVTEQGNGVTLVEAVLDTAPGSDAAKSTVASLRTSLAGFPQTYVSGTDATTIDAKDSLVRDLLLIIPIVVVLVTLTLGLLLRSVVAPIVLVATVVATYAAALGASWWIFTGIFGYEGLEVNVPLIGFVFLVALGVDYNIFLVTRAREETATRGTRVAMLYALGATGGVITSAGILLAAVFTVLGLLPAVALAQVGVLICIGVLLDTLLIRTVLVPAIAIVLGDRFWWPRPIAQQPTPVPQRSNA